MADLAPFAHGCPAAGQVWLLTLDSASQRGHLSSGPVLPESAFPFGKRLDSRPIRQRTGVGDVVVLVARLVSLTHPSLPGYQVQAMWKARLKNA